MAPPLCNQQSFQTHPSRSPTSHLLPAIYKHHVLKPVTGEDALELDAELGKGRAPSAFTPALAEPLVSGSHWIKKLLLRPPSPLTLGEDP